METNHEVGKKVKTTWNSPNDNEVAAHRGVDWTTRCNPAKEVTCGCGLCKKLESLPQEIHELEEALTTLKAIRTRVSNNSKINAVNDPLSRLPIELVSDIFMYLRPLPMEVAYRLDVDEPDDVAKSMKTPLLLGAVCKAWRTFAWSIPRLWSTISVNVYNENEDVPDIIRQWLRRSGQLPLCVYLYTAQRRLDDGFLSPSPYGDEPFVERLMAVINEYSGRWFYLNLEIPKRFMLYVHCSGSEAPMLETLTLQIPVDHIPYTHLASRRRIKIGATPNLRRIHFSPALTIDDINMDWGSVVHADISNPELDMCCDLLRQAPTLTHLTLRKIGVNDQPSSIFRHQSLVSLQMFSCGSHYYEPDALLSYLDLPALEDLGIFASCKYNLNTLTAFLQRSSCALKKFRLNIYERWMEHKRELITILDKMPCLEFLDINCRYLKSHNSPIESQLPTPIMIQEMDSINESLFLPKLEIVHVKLGFHRRLESYSLDLLLRRNNPNTATSQRSEQGHFVPFDTLRLKPLHIYYLLDMATQQALRPMINSNFETKSCTTDLNPFVDFLRQALSSYVYDSGVRLVSD